MESRARQTLQRGLREYPERVRRRGRWCGGGNVAHAQELEGQFDFLSGADGHSDSSSARRCSQTTGAQFAHFSVGVRADDEDREEARDPLMCSWRRARPQGAPELHLASESDVRKVVDVFCFPRRMIEVAPWRGCGALSFVRLAFRVGGMRSTREALLKSRGFKAQARFFRLRYRAHVVSSFRALRPVASVRQHQLSLRCDWQLSAGCGGRGAGVLQPTQQGRPMFPLWWPLGAGRAPSNAGKGL